VRLGTALTQLCFGALSGSQVRSEMSECVSLCSECAVGDCFDAVVFWGTVRFPGAIRDE